MQPSTTQRELLRAHRVLIRAGLSLASVFAWVFIFEYTLVFSHSVADSFFVALLVYAISQAVVLGMTPISASHLRSGVKRSLLSGALVAALAFVVLGATLTGYFATPVGWGLALFGILLGIYRALYWIPYRLQHAVSGSGQYALLELLIALMPAFAGATLTLVMFSSLRLFFGAASLMLLSIIPVMLLRDVHEKFEWGYAETFKKFASRRYRKLSLRTVFAGAENAALFVLWPLAVFLIVDGSYMIFGIVMTASLLVLLAVRSIYVSYIHAHFPERSLALDVAFSMSGWILRLAAGTPIAIVFADSYSYVSAPSGSPEFFAREHAADGGSYLDEYTALQEIGMAIGRIAMCVLVSILLFTVPVSITLALAFVLAALSAGAAAAFSHKARIEAY